MENILSNNAYDTLQELIRANSVIEDRGVIFIHSEIGETFISFKELYHKALEVLYRLQKRGIEAGDELILQVNDLQMFVVHFWACILGGVIPVPVTAGNSIEHKFKLFNIWKNLKHPFLAMEKKLFNKLEIFALEKDLIPVYKSMSSGVSFIEDIEYIGRKGSVFPAKPNDAAYIQFTSGTTAEPKGVILTHRNLLATAEAIYHGSEMSAGDVLLSWMPMTHDLGLNGCHLVPFWGRYNQYLMPTSLFIRHPALWLKKAAEHKASILSSSNFGLKYLLMKVKAVDDKDLDLSCVRLVFNGAEPVSAKLCDEFIRRFKKNDLQKNTMFTVYGMAEAGLAVTFPPPGEEFVTVDIKADSIGIGRPVMKASINEGGIRFVDLGYPVPFCAARICDDRNRVLDEGITGNIQIKGGNVTPGYYENPTLNEMMFTADGWLDTGDIGFMNQGRLVVMGRASEMITLKQRNIFPHMIERIIGDRGEHEFGEVVFCGVNNQESGDTEPLLFVFYKRSLADFIAPAYRLKEFVKKNTGLKIKLIIPVKKIPKTTSGKIQRYKLVESYLNGEFTELIAQIEEMNLAELDGEKRGVAI